MAAPRSALRRDARRPFVVACAMWMSASGRIATVADRPIAAVGTALHSSRSSMLVGQLQTYTECKENPHRGLDRHKRAARFACRQQRPRYVTPRLRLRAMDRARTGLAAPRLLCRQRFFGRLHVRCLPRFSACTEGA